MNRYVISLLSFLCAAMLHADQLWVFYAPGCHHCEKFIEQAYPHYPNKSHWSTKLPLPIIRLFNIALDVPDDHATVLDRDIESTPTFVLIDDDQKPYKELGRFEGYTSEAGFYQQLEKLLCEHSKYVTCTKDKKE